MGKVFQNATKVSSIRTEEYLFGAEDSRDNIRGYIPAFKFVEVVRPKFIFNKYGFRGFGQVEESSYIARQVERKVANKICS